MSSPDEPGYPRVDERPGDNNGSTAEGSSGSGAIVATGHVSNSADVAPWERGTGVRASEVQQRSAPEQQEEPPVAPHGDSSAPAVPAVHDRVDRFLTGGSAPMHEVDKPHPRARIAAYASELPDLSGPVPRPPKRQSPSDRPIGDAPARAATAGATGRIQAGGRQRGPVRASMQIRRIDPWSTLKVSLVVSVALFFVWMIAVALLYLVLGAMGVWTKLNSNVGDLLTAASGSGGELVSSGTIFGGATLIGLVNIVLLSAMATVGAFIYNLVTDLVGGIEVTLADRD